MVTKNITHTLLEYCFTTPKKKLCVPRMIKEYRPQYDKNGILFTATEKSQITTIPLNDAMYIRGRLVSCNVLKLTSGWAVSMHITEKTIIPTMVFHNGNFIMSIL